MNGIFLVSFRWRSVIKLCCLYWGGLVSLFSGQNVHHQELIIPTLPVYHASHFSMCWL